MLTDQYAARFPQSAQRYRAALDIFPSGVTHDGRYLTPFPIYVESAHGATKRTIDGVDLVDYWSGHGSLLLGHTHPDLVAAVSEQVARGTHFGACHERELEWGALVQQLVPSAERVRFTSSGTEATLMAVRLARIVTGRSKIVKFAGHFHGWHDTLAPAADPPHDDPAYPTPGLPVEVSGQLVVVRPNDPAALAAAIEQHKPAAVICEATGGRWGVVPIRGEFLQQVRALTRETGTVFILDEVITGFRVAPGGAQQHYGVTPDLTALAKIVAGGLPGGALVGGAEFLEPLEFENRRGVKMKHPGTYNGNPLSAAAGVAMLKHVATGEPCTAATAAATQLKQRLNELFASAGVPWLAYGEFSLLHILFDYDGPPPSDDAAFIPHAGVFDRLDRATDRRMAHAFRAATLLGGVDCMGTGLITTTAHDAAALDRTVAGFAVAIDLLRQEQLVA